MLPFSTDHQGMCIRGMQAAQPAWMTCHRGVRGVGAATLSHGYADLQELIEQESAKLSQLHRDVAEATSHLGDVRAARRLETNGQPGPSALRVRTDAEIATAALSDVSREARLDSLTGLPSRALLLDRFAQARAGARRHGRRMALLFINLENFNQIDDSLGHAESDQLLRRVAARLASSVRQADTVSRHGRAEFVVLLTEVSRASDTAQVANKMLAVLNASGGVGDPEMHPTARIGVSIYPDDGEDAETLIGHAGAAVSRAGMRGLGRVAYHGTEPASERGPEQAGRPRERVANELERDSCKLQDAGDARTPFEKAAPCAQGMPSTGEQAHQRLTQLLAVVAHELRNPIAPIRSAAAMLVRARSDQLPRLQSIIERQVVRLLGLIDDLLDVSRINAGKLRIECELVEIDSVIDEAVDACQPAIDRRLQHLSVDVPAGALEVDGDPSRLVQIVSNLLDNASKYTPDGGKIGLSVAAAKDSVVISVSDEGIGITAEGLPHVFEPFMQDPHAVGFNGAGLGIGLSVVRELVEAHGGSVAVRSAGVGQGSQFVVMLPLAGGCPRR